MTGYNATNAKPGTTFAALDSPRPRSSRSTSTSARGAGLLAMASSSTTTKPRIAATCRTASPSTLHTGPANHCSLARSARPRVKSSRNAVARPRELATTSRSPIPRLTKTRTGSRTPEMTQPFTLACLHLTQTPRTPSTTDPRTMSSTILPPTWPRASLGKNAFRNPDGGVQVLPAGAPQPRPGTLL